MAGHPEESNADQAYELARVTLRQAHDQFLEQQLPFILAQVAGDAPLALIGTMGIGKSQTLIPLLSAQLAQHGYEPVLIDVQMLSFTKVDQLTLEDLLGSAEPSRAVLLIDEAGQAPSPFATRLMQLAQDHRLPLLLFFAQRDGELKPAQKSKWQLETAEVVPLPLVRISPPQIRHYLQLRGWSQPQIEELLTYLPLAGINPKILYYYLQYYPTLSNLWSFLEESSVDWRRWGLLTTTEYQYISLKLDPDIPIELIGDVRD